MMVYFMRMLRSHEKSEFSQKVYSNIYQMPTFLPLLFSRIVHPKVLKKYSYSIIGIHLAIEWPKHKLSIRANHKPELATEGEEFTVTYTVKNIGSDSFPGGNLTILLSWPSMSQNVGVTDPLVISKPLSPNSEFSSNEKKHTALIAGYTFFQVINAKANDGKMSAKASFPFPGV
jgi:hypothetical protein